jgi:chromosome segregation ATPase
MARRIISTQKAADSTKPSDAVKAAERRAAEVGESIAVMQAHKAELEKKIAELDASVHPKIEAVGIITDEFERVSRQLASAEAEMNAVHSEIALLVAERARLHVEAELDATRQSAEHGERVRVLKETYEKMQREFDELAARKAAVAVETALLRENSAILAENIKLQGASLQEAKKRRDDFDQLESQLLAKKLEVAQTEQQRAKLAALAADEKNAYEEASSKRRAEENRIAELLAQLAAREADIAAKHKQLRAVKEAVDVAVTRLLRKEHDEEIKVALRETYNVII